MVGYFQTLPCLSLFVDNFVNVCSLWYRFLVHMHMLRLDFLSVKTTVSLVFNKIPFNLYLGHGRIVNLYVRIN